MKRAWAGLALVAGHERNPVGRNQAHIPGLAEGLACIAKAGGFEIRPSVLRAIRGKRPHIGAIALYAGHMRVSLEVHRKAEEGQESCGNNRCCDNSVNCSEHDTHPFVPRPCEAVIRTFLSGCGSIWIRNYSGWARVSLMRITLCGFMRAVCTRLNALIYMENC